MLISNIVNGQYSYSYVEPCTKKMRSIQIPTNQSQITVNYYGNVKIFEANDFYNGNFALWVQTVSSSGLGKPCDEVGIILTKNLNMVVAQTSVTTILNVNSVTQNLLTNASFSSVGQSAVNSGSSPNVNVNENKEAPKKENINSEKKQDSPNSQTKENTKSDSKLGSDNGTTGESKKSPENKPEEIKSPGSSNGSSGSATSNSISNAENNSGTGGDKKEESKKENTNTEKTQDPSNSQTKETPKSDSKSGSGSEGSGTTGETKKSPENKSEDEKSSGGSSGSATSNSVSNAEDNSGTGGGGDKKGGSKVKTGSVIGTGDIVLLRSAEDEKAANQYRITGSLTRTNTTNTRVWGVLYNFTTQINLSNITLYRAWVLPKSQWTIIGANSSMLNPDRDAFNTTTLVASKRFKGNWKKLTLMSGLNFTTAKIGESNLNNLSSVGGGFFSYNLTKKVSGSLLCLAVYSPFTHFYEGKWWESGILLVPFNSWDYSITKTFKFNMSFSGVYEMNNSMLNYQVLMGGKILL